MPSVITGPQLSEIRELSGQPPVGEAFEAIQEVDHICITGPMSIGKDTVIGLTGLPEVAGFTTRPRRRFEAGYRFYPDVTEQYSSLIADWRAGRIVQGELGLGNYLYGSETGDYPQEGIALNQVFASEAVDMRRFPFRSQREVCLVEGMWTWSARVTESRGDIKDQRERILRDMAELAIALDDPEFIFIPNWQDKARDAAKAVIALTQGEEPSDASLRKGREVGAELHRMITDRLGLPLLHPVS